MAYRLLQRLKYSHQYVEESAIKRFLAPRPPPGSLRGALSRNGGPDLVSSSSTVKLDSAGWLKMNSVELDWANFSNLVQLFTDPQLSPESALQLRFDNERKLAKVWKAEEDIDDFEAACSISQQVSEALREGFVERVELDGVKTLLTLVEPSIEPLAVPGLGVGPPLEPAGAAKGYTVRPWSDARAIIATDSVEIFVDPYAGMLQSLGMTWAPVSRGADMDFDLRVPAAMAPFTTTWALFESELRATAAVAAPDAESAAAEHQESVTIDTSCGREIAWKDFCKSAALTSRSFCRPYKFRVAGRPYIVEFH
ncbi:hypothetical protein WJX74_005868 [Apatococcus lobatus]|uniref:Uncharacterized protein n=1 Tax=Apatococcus lobatus TaxID=904363 RepID=A0AAW1R220_9CHLO